MKEMTNVASAVMTDEEKAEMEKDMKAAHAEGSPSGSAAIPSTPHEHQEQHQSPTSAKFPNMPHATDEPLLSPKPSVHPTGSPSPSHPTSPSTSPSPSPTPGSVDAHKHAEARKKGKQKLTVEQKAKLEELDKQRREKMEARVDMLVVKLIERLRPFVEAHNPNDPQDPEVKAFLQKMQLEAEDLKLESFGVEVCV